MVTPLMLDQMVETVRSLTSNKEHLLVEGRRSRSYYEIFHKPENLVDMYERFFTELLSSDSGIGERVP